MFPPGKYETKWKITYDEGKIRKVMPHNIGIAFMYVYNIREKGTIYRIRDVICNNTAALSTHKILFFVVYDF